MRVPAASALRFAADSSRSCLTLARRAMSVLASSVFPARWSYMPRNISSIFNIRVGNGHRWGVNGDLYVAGKHIKWRNIVDQEWSRTFQYRSCASFFSFCSLRWEKSNWYQQRCMSDQWSKEKMATYRVSSTLWVRPDRRSLSSWQGYGWDWLDLHHLPPVHQYL